MSVISHDSATNSKPYLNLGLSHLQLGVRAHNACSENGCRSILDVQRAFSANKLSEAIVGKKTHQEIGKALEDIRSCELSDGHIDWPGFWQARPLSPARIAITSKGLETLNTLTKNEPIGILHLKKACAGLEAADIKTVGILLDAAKKGIGKLPNFGKVAREEVVEALIALDKAIGEDGDVDWAKFASGRGYQMLPAVPIDASNPDKILDVLPDLCKAVVLAQYSQREWEIFNRRLIRPGGDRETLDSIGQVYGITRERIRQLQEYCLEDLKKPLLRNDYQGLTFRFQTTFVQFFHDAQGHFNSLNLPAWKESDWMSELADLWRIPTERIERYDRLLSELMDYVVVRPDHSSLEPLVLSCSTSTTEAKKMAKSVSIIHDRLLSDPRGTDAFELVRALRTAGIESANPDEIPTLAGLCSSVEVTGDDSSIYRLKFAELRGRADQAVRVLYEKGAPMHYSDIIREVNRRLPTEKRIAGKTALIGHLSKDERLQPVGKSGKWSLTEWGTEVRPLVQVIEDVLETAGEALSEAVITEKVLQMRPGSAASIPMILTFNQNLFRRVAPGIYGVAAWGDSSDGGAQFEDAVANFVEAFFETRGISEIDFKELRQAYATSAGLSTRSAAGILATNPAVSIQMPNTWQRIASYNSKWRTQPRATRTYRRNQPLQADQINEQAKQLVTASGVSELPLVDVVKSIEHKLKVNRVNVYSALSQCEDLEKVAVEGSAFKVLRLRGAKKLDFPQLAQMQNEDWRKESERAVSKLTLEDVDIGLFILGRQFDQAMKQLLLEARNAGVPVLSGHIERLNGRIDWAYNQGLFTDKATLNLLRVERNARGHNPPTQEEQKAAMKYAPYLAGLYLDYLLMIEKLVDKYKATSTGKPS